MHLEAGKSCKIIEHLYAPRHRSQTASTRSPQFIKIYLTKGYLKIAWIVLSNDELCKFAPKIAPKPPYLAICIFNEDYTDVLKIIELRGVKVEPTAG